MIRIAGVVMQNDKQAYIALSRVYGIGQRSAMAICDSAGIDFRKKMNDLQEDEIRAIVSVVSKDYVVEGDLRRRVSMDIRSLMDSGCYRGLRHRSGLPVRGQRTRTNSRTRKGKAKPIAAKKK